ncbi:protein-glutamate methylesterase/protein-glutamine glutaminase [Occallatibacter riparius]|uniref:Protein-glutamate methylesterase/protein-glutamine glutaminase n=1 Tax=Occallatibacter riparius TaxID=1002689 RepID=A0A9J7BSS4_9BACT|nr:chemotaxis response regulator protein-glutamate methylesterase [Occallatibacter riparius]UWZ84077.1 chemotaxis response regulator protein-glutamate methylesterase [Occallatibacter riparius]
MTIWTRRTKVLIVDDSAVMRSLLRSVLATDAQLEVAGTAVDGVAALQSVATLAPDLMLLDVDMPVMDGLTTLKRLRAAGHRLPVIMCSGLTQRGARVTIEALANGAADYVAKPTAQQDRDAATRTLAAQLLPKIHALASITLPQRRPAPSARPAATQSAATSAPAVLAIGVSTGGPDALEKLLPALPSRFPLPVVVVQHMPALFTGMLAEHLDKSCRLRVREAAEGLAVVPGNIFIARGDSHLEVIKTPPAGHNSTLHLTNAPPENHCRPSVDVLFRSLAEAYGGSVLAVVLTGMGYDGLAGCRVLRNKGATVLAQDEASSTVWGMPGAVATAGLAHRVLSLGEMAPEIMRLTVASSNEALSLREAAV